MKELTLEETLQKANNLLSEIESERKFNFDKQQLTNSVNELNIKLSNNISIKE